MRNDQILMGMGVALFAIVGLGHASWVLDHLRIGRWASRLFGPARGLTALRVLFLAAVVFGILLALDVIRPVRWN